MAQVAEAWYSGRQPVAFTQVWCSRGVRYCGIYSMLCPPKENGNKRPAIMVELPHGVPEKANAPR